jgi:hypothetical protein
MVEEPSYEEQTMTAADIFNLCLRMSFLYATLFGLFKEHEARKVQATPAQAARPATVVPPSTGTKAHAAFHQGMEDAAVAMDEEQENQSAAANKKRKVEAVLQSFDDEVVERSGIGKTTIKYLIPALFFNFFFHLF